VRLLNGALASTKIPDDPQGGFVIANIQVNRAAQFRYRRIHQAHGRVKCYASQPTNVQIVITEQGAVTPAVSGISDQTQFISRSRSSTTFL
jgi:hypothetical protein